MSKLCNSKIETGIIYKYNHIRLPGQYILLAPFEIAHNFSDVEQHLPKPHYSTLLVVANQLSSRALHKLSSPTSDFTIRLNALQPLDKIGAVQIARCLSGYDVVFCHTILTSII